MLKRKEHQALLNSSLAALGYIPPQTDEEVQAFEELYKDYVPRIKDRKIERELALRRNFMLNMPQAFPKEYMVGLNHYTSLLSRLNFQNNIVQYNIEEEMFEFSLYFKNDIKLSLSLMADESEDLADFSVFQHHELLVADVMPVKSLVTKMEKLLKKINEYWGEFHCEEKEVADKWDSHTKKDILNRLSYSNKNWED